MLARQNRPIFWINFRGPRTMALPFLGYNQEVIMNTSIKSIFIVACGLFITSFITLQAEIKYIIWDLGYVLIEPDTNVKMAQLGRGDCISYGITNFFNGNIHIRKTLTQLMYDVLIQAGGPQTEPLELQLCDNERTPLPKLFADWQLGRITAAQVHALVDQTLVQLKNECYFASAIEARLVTNCIKKATIHPKGLARGMKPGKACELLELLSQEGKYEFYVLSNWDAESFNYILQDKLLQEKVFSYMKPEHLMYSGKYGLAKPHPEFFKLLLNMYDLNPAECLFIDDQAENIATAQACGMQVIQWDKKNYKKILKKLRKQGLLS